jgi:hypothetical protein
MFFYFDAEGFREISLEELPNCRAVHGETLRD